MPASLPGSGRFPSLRRCGGHLSRNVRFGWQPKAGVFAALSPLNRLDRGNFSTRESASDLTPALDFEVCPLNEKSAVSTSACAEQAGRCRLSNNRQPLEEQVRVCVRASNNRKAPVNQHRRETRRMSSRAPILSCDGGGLQARRY